MTSLRPARRMTLSRVILGLDVSTRTGACLAQAHDVRCRVIHHKPVEGNRFLRWQRYGADLSEFLGDRKVDFAVIEGYAYANKHTLVTLVEVGSLLRDFLTRAGIKWVEVAPTTLKKFATGMGSSKKQQMLLAAYKHFGVESEDDDVVDATLLAKFGQALVRELPHSLPQNHTQAVLGFAKTHGSQLRALGA